MAEQTQIAAERDSLLLYHTATQTADVLSDPSMAVHTVLDVVGMIPAIGEAADLLNAAIYAAEGNHLDAGLSLAGAIPFAGAAVAVARTARNIGKAVDAAVTASRLQDAFRVVDAIPTRAATPPTPDLTAPRVPDTPGTTPGPPETQPAVPRLNEPVPGAQVAPSCTVRAVENPYPRGAEPYKNTPSPNAETVIGPYNPREPYHYVDVAGARGSSHFDIGTAWDEVTGPVENAKYIDEVIARQDTVHSTVSVSELYRLRDEALQAGKVPPGDSLLREWEQLQGAGYTWTGPNTLSPPGI